MDGFTNPKIEKQSIYEIYRACRLCGAGAGYKMPIIQNVVDLDSEEVELKQKVRECVQIEVHQDDKMPPLICELCVDKVNDFYEFLEMCRQTNKQTRLRLGLPPQTLPRGAPDAGDCILGVTEPIFIDNEDSNDEPISRSKPKVVKTVKGKEPDSRDSRTKDMKKEKEVERKSFKDRHEPRALRRRVPSPPSPSPPRLLRGTKRSHEDDVSLSRLQEKEVERKSFKDRHEPRSLRRSVPSPPSPSPPRLLRGTKRSHEDDVSLSRLQKTRKSDEPMPRSILKRDRESQSEERAKITRLREKENEKIANEKANSKKVVKIMVKKENFKSLPKAPSLKPRDRTPPPVVHKCKICKKTFDKTQSLSNHLRTHAREKPPERKPSPPPKKEMKKIKSSKQETDEKPEKPVSKPQKPVSKPQRVTAPKKRAEVPIDPELLKQLRPLQVRISKCDPLLENKLGDHYDASDVDYDYGLDKTCVYPYIYTFRHLRIKSEPLYMVNIQDEIKNAIDKDDNYVHWDSDETGSDLDLDDSKSVDTLTSISLKTLFSQKVLGKVPKKRRKVKVEKAFDSILNSTNDFDSDMRLGIDNIINSLGDDKDKSILDDYSAKIDKTDNDSLFGDDDSPAIPVTNDDFDSLFSSDATKGKDKNVDSKSVDSTITNFSMDFDDVSGKVDKSPSKENTVQDSKSLESKELNKSDDSEDKNDENDITTNTDDKNDSKDDSNDINNTDTYKSTIDNKENNDASSYLNDKVRDDQTVATENDSSKTDSSVTKDSEKDINSENKDKGKDDANHVNGQTELEPEFNMDDLEDVSDSEMEESSLMQDVDKQIGEKGMANAKTDVSERDKTVTGEGVPVSVKSADLESISDGEFE
ncbi:eukaryotic translation initiation factor 5B-like isoform X2 [Maniola jurtina]|uniref:eukaryotic translation initiation factor 5B-like isoform X2 n=1 Tax=Maniola jurtina TaxID=191418 RepID=UPI001E68FD3E|nr:eukaryotic translation initiation factor 5B-like isoform X2 [Maniola jurtina]